MGPLPRTSARLPVRTGSPKPCVVNCDNIRLIPKSLTKCAGELAPERWVEVKRAVGAAWDGGS